MDNWAGTSTDCIPNTPMRWTIQTKTGTAPDGNLKLTGLQSTLIKSGCVLDYVLQQDQERPVAHA
jgi:hypothetical protein